MAEVSRLLPVTPAEVWAVFANGWTYSRWVVGTGGIRAVDPDFPADGTRLHYRIGRRPLAKMGSTTVVSSSARERIELEAEGWPLGTAYITIGLAREGSSTRVTLEEHPKSGPAAVLHNPIADLIVRLRNVETLRRLEKTVLGVP